MKKIFFYVCIGVFGAMIGYSLQKPKTIDDSHRPVAQPVAEVDADGDLESEVRPVNRPSPRIEKKADEAPESDPIDVAESQEKVEVLPNADIESEVGDDSDNPKLFTVEASDRLIAELESSLVSNNTQEQNLKVLKKLEVKDLNKALSLQAQQPPLDRLESLLGNYEGELKFQNRDLGVGLAKVSFSGLDYVNSRLTVKISLFSSSGDDLSRLEGTTGIADFVNRIRGSSALFIKVSPFEQVQLYVGDHGLIGNYYERKDQYGSFEKTGVLTLEKLM